LRAVAVTVFFAIALTVLITAYTWVGWRLLGPFSTGASRLGWTVLVAHLLSVVVSITLIRTVGAAGWVRAIHWFAYIGMGLFALVLTGLVIRDLLWGGVWFVDRVMALGGGSLKWVPHDPERRELLFGMANVGILALSGIAGTLGFVAARRTPRVVEVDIPIANLPDALDGYRIAQITDLHVGPTIGRDFVDGVVAVVNRLSPDLIAVTGDLVDGAPEQLLPQMGALRTLQAVDGVYFVTGNHEYYSGPLRWCRAVADLGMTVLNNAHRVIERDGARLLIAGVTDHRAHTVVPAHRSDPAAAVAGAAPCDARILLAHQPKSCHAAVEVGFDLQISGHTHGGQMWPWNLFVRLSQPFISGLNRLDSMWVYVSRGTGYWGPPMRIGVPSEITLLRLVRSV
jgi:predicted MPP superfamily phosphohydrolase